jgi:Ni,Fe-hydrogenase III large subunit
LALGPFTTALRDPQRLVLQVDGERVADVDYRGGYNERGCAERLSRLNLDDALHLVSRICGSASHTHSLAFCQALEALLELDVSPRAAYLRSIGAELERLSSHVQTLIALFEALAMGQVAARLTRLHGSARRAMKAFSGKPAMPDVCLPGGVRQNLNDQQRTETLQVLNEVNQPLFQLIGKVIDQRAVLRRTVEVGVFSGEAASQFGARGPLARAAGVAADVRIDQPYAAYQQLEPKLVTQDGGDVYARVVVLLLESLESVRLAMRALEDLPAGSAQGSTLKALAKGEGESSVESPQGRLRYHVESNGQRITAAAIDPPRPLDRLTIRTLLNGALIDDVPLIIVSTNACAACAEL